MNAYEALTDTVDNAFVVTTNEDGFATLDKYVGSVEPYEITVPQYVDVQGIRYTINKLGDYAFSNSPEDYQENIGRWGSELHKVVLPETIDTIADYVFLAQYGALRLQEINLPNKCVHIGAYAFGLQSELQNVTLPEALQVIGYHAFANCTKAFSEANLTLPDAVTAIGGYAFASCTMRTVTFSQTSRLNSIDSYAFSYNENLLIVTLPQSLVTLGERAFWRCNNLNEIQMNGGGNDYFISHKRVLYNKVSDDSRLSS